MQKSIKSANVPNRLAELRKERGLTQQELAEKLYIDGNTVSRFERGKFLTLDALLKFSDIFGVSLDYILLRTDIKALPRTLGETEIAILTQLEALSKAETC